MLFVVVLALVSTCCCWMQQPWPRGSNREPSLLWFERGPYPRRHGGPPVALVQTELGRKLRRRLYEALAPVDRGDFRWELLVPWTNKTLTQTDKFIVCCAFVGSSFTIQTLFDPGASVGVHLSYIAQFFSYAMGDPIGFRLLAVLTSLLEIAGDLFEEKGRGIIVSGFQSKDWWDIDTEDAFPVFYNELFIFINMYYILRWVLNWEAFVSGILWEDEIEALYTQCFNPLGFRRAQFARLLREAKFETAGSKGTVLSVQGQPMQSVYVTINGTFEVRVSGGVASRIKPYQVIGEASLLENLQSVNEELRAPARATVIAEPGSVYVRWPQSFFYMLKKEEDSDFDYAIQLMISRTLSAKLADARQETRMLRAQTTSITEVASGRPLWPRLREADAKTSATASSIQGVNSAIIEAQALAERTEELERTIARLRRQLETAQQQSAELSMSFLAFFAAFLGLIFYGMGGEFLEIPTLAVI